MNIARPTPLLLVPVVAQPTAVLTALLRHGMALSFPEVRAISEELDRRRAWERRGNRFATAPNRPKQGGASNRG